MRSLTRGSRSEPAESSPDTRERPRRWTLVALGIILAVAGWLRFADLGRLSFWADEFPHAIAARSLIHTGHPTLAPGHTYRRALAQTVTVAASMRVFGENETAARVPSALIGLATIAGVWFVARHRFGDTAAVAAAAVIAVMPLHVAHSRSARFYAAFAFAYGTAAALGTTALETRSRRTAIGALAAFAVALHLQVEAATLMPALLCYAVYLWGRSPAHRSSLGRIVVLLAAASAAAIATIATVPQLRHGAVRLIDHLPGLELKPGLHFDALGKLFGVVDWWVWVALVPAAVAGLRRAGRSGIALLLHLLVPAVLLAVLFKPTAARGISSRYVFYLVPLLAVLVGVASAELVRWSSKLIRRLDPDSAVASIATVALSIVILAGAVTVWRLPGEAHPSRLIPRPDWNAATSFVRAHAGPGDALLSTSPLAPAWALGRCADWIRTPAAAAQYLDDNRDIYCGSELVPDVAALRSYMASHPRGWVIADPVQWAGIVDPGVRTLVDEVFTPVDLGDRSVLLWRWGA